jgi:hypothetical protein
MNVAVGIAAAALAADTTPAAVDLQGFNGAEIMLAIGVGGITFDATNKIEFVLTHSDDDSSYSNVADADMLGVSGISGGIVKSLVAAHTAAAVYRYGYIGGKRYLKLKADFSGTHVTATPIAGVILKGAPARRPQAAQA